MLKGISYWSLKDGLAGTHPIEEGLEEVRQAGFEALELCINTSGVLSTTTSEKECTAIRKTIDKSGVVVETVASGMSWDFSPTHPDPEVRRKAIDLHKAALERCAWLGCKSLLYVPGAISIPWNPDYPKIRYQKAIELADKAVSELLPTAEKHDVEICVENVWNGIFYSPLELRDFIESFESPNVKVYFDIGNVLGYHQDPADWIQTFHKIIGRIHVKDFKRSIGTLDGFCDLGEGDVPWSEVLAALKAIGYNRTLIAEMVPWKEGQIERTAAAMQKLFL